MSFRINTNVAAMTAHMYSLENSNQLDSSLTRLSSGLRINKAADDASGLAIADTLHSQASGLGQAIKNANDGINVVQTADGALGEYTNIINTIRTKSIQAASDGQNSDSRAAIQRDISKLLEQAQSIATTTAFNGQNLLDGTFTNKHFQTGAYANQTVSVSIGNVKTDSVGEITSVSNNASNATDGLATWTALAAGNITETASGNVLKSNDITVNGFDVASSLNTLSPLRLQDAKALAAAVTDATGLTAQGSTRLDGALVGGGTIASTDTVKINGYDIGITGKAIAAGDADGSLVRAINDVSANTGVTATTSGGKLVLSATDGRNIAIDITGAGAAATATATGLTSNVTTAVGSGAVGTLASTATAAVTIAQGELVVNGVDLAGVYGDGTTIGSAGTALQAKLQSISGLGDSTVSAAGLVTLTVNNGDDLNIAGSTANSTFNLTKGVTNTSQHGVVNIFSNDKVAIGGSVPAAFGFTSGGYTPSTSSNISLSTVDASTRNGAEVGMLISDAALKQIDTIRSQIGSTQNQLESTVRNISVTKVNVTAAESAIRDVDFAAESAKFAKHNILAQSGAYAMSQANIVQKNVLRLLQ